MNYFYILITKKENLELLQDTVNLIKQYCLKDSNKYSISLDKKNHSNCLLERDESNIQVYKTDEINYAEFEKQYLTKYKISKQDLEVFFNIYNSINIEKVEEFKVQVKITYNFSLISALELIINLLGKEESLNMILEFNEGEIFNQVIVNESNADSAIIENNYIYYSTYLNGNYKKTDKLEKNHILQKYYQYKKLNKKFLLKGHKEVSKI